MLSLAHTATGALIATKVHSPFLSVPLIFASHYLEDFILHWDVGTGLSKGLKKPSDAFKHELVDLLLSAIFIYLVFQSTQPLVNYQAWFGAFIALIPDFLEVPRNFLRTEPKFLKPLNDFHHYFHHSTPNVLLGLTPQIIVLIAIALLA